MLTRRQHDRLQRLAGRSGAGSGRVSGSKPAKSDARPGAGEPLRSGTGGMGAASRIAIERSTAARRALAAKSRVARRRGQTR